MSSASRFAAVLLLLAGCPGPDDTGGVEMGCELGIPDEDGVFVPLQTGDNLELVLGFQGFLFIDLLARTDDSSATPATGSVSLTPQDGEAILTTQRVDLDPQTGVSNQIMVFLEVSEMANYIGKPAQLAVRLQSEDAWCLVVDDFVMADDDDCIHTTETDTCMDEEDLQ